MNENILRIGTVLRERYRLEQYIASGGFGITYKVYDIHLNESFALKEFFCRTINSRDPLTQTVTVINPNNIQDYEALQNKFKKEALRIRSLHSDHIVQVYDIFDENGTSYYVMDYVDGESLQSILNRIGPLPEEKVLGYLEQTLDALDEIHNRSIWHLDIKPDNILLDSKGCLKLIDFGASKLIDLPSGAMTSSVAIAYTPGFAPLEQTEQQLEHIGASTDLYALGATLYNLLTGERPYSGAKIATNSISPMMCHLVGWLMQINREKRPQSVAQVRSYIDANISDKKNSRVKYFFGAIVIALLSVLLYFTVSDTKPDLVKVPGSKYFKVNGVSFAMVPVEGGTFIMGDNNSNSNERPAHKMALTGFYIGQTEVTQELWQAVMGSNPSYFKDDPHRPVEQVSWEKCQEFIDSLNKLTGQVFRLPREVEWEFAARGGNLTHGYGCAGSNEIDSVSWYKVNAFDVGSDSNDYGTHVVGTKKPNELGIYDMSGNVYEWCHDWYGDYVGDFQTELKGSSLHIGRVIRGGSWCYEAKQCLVSYRSNLKPESSYKNLGFRLAL